jgi:hypothetical protein
MESVSSEGETITTRWREAFCTTSSNVSCRSANRLSDGTNMKAVSCVSPGRKYFARDVLHMLGHILPQALGGLMGTAIIGRVAIGVPRLHRKLGINHKARRAIGQEDHAVGPLAVGQRVLERIGPARQRILHDGLHPPLAESAARLLVGKDGLQRHHALRQLGDVLLRGVDGGQPLVQADRRVSCVWLVCWLIDWPSRWPRPSMRSDMTRASSACRLPSISRHRLHPRTQLGLRLGHAGDAGGEFGLFGLRLCLNGCRAPGHAQGRHPHPAEQQHDERASGPGGHGKRHRCALKGEQD